MGELFTYLSQQFNPNTGEQMEAYYLQWKTETQDLVGITREQIDQIQATGDLDRLTKIAHYNIKALRACSGALNDQCKFVADGIAASHIGKVAELLTTFINQLDELTNAVHVKLIPSLVLQIQALQSKPDEGGDKSSSSSYSSGQKFLREFSSKFDREIAWIKERIPQTAAPLRGGRSGSVGAPRGGRQNLAGRQENAMEVSEEAKANKQFYSNIYLDKQHFGAMNKNQVLTQVKDWYYGFKKQNLEGELVLKPTDSYIRVDIKCTGKEERKALEKTFHQIFKQLSSKIAFVKRGDAMKTFGQVKVKKSK